MPGRAFVIDFDGTITTTDTIGILANCGIEWQAKRGSDMKGVWEEIVRSYQTDYYDHVGDYRPGKEDRRTLEEETRYQRGLRAVEERSFGRVSRSRLFEDMGKQVWENAGRQAVMSGDVTVRKGFMEFIRRLEEQAGIWGIVSVNFSDSFIRGVVVASAGFEVKDVEILANSPDEKGSLLGPKSNLGGVVATSDAKLVVMKAILQSWSEKGLVDISRPVYIGDSGTDIECLTVPGITGIIMTEDVQKNLGETMERIGIDVVPIREYLEHDAPSANRVYLAHDFGDILQSNLLSQSCQA